MKKAITGSDLLRYVRNLNVKHNVDNGSAGSLFVEYCRPYQRVLKYRVGINATSGVITVTGVSSPREVIEELKQKNWRHIIAVATGKQTRGFCGD